MITVSLAKTKIEQSVKPLAAIKVKLNSAAGYVLATDITAPISLPSFRQSSMDGYAVRHDDIVEKGSTLTITGESKAGISDSLNLKAGEAIRIFTGAAVPDGATAVIMQENTERNVDRISILEYPVAEGKNVREIGHQIHKGEIAVEAGTLITPSVAGYIAGFGVTEVEVYEKPKMAILITGDELVRDETALRKGQVYESNSIALKAALAKEGIDVVKIGYAEDTLEGVKEKLNELALEADIILSSGGISVGDYDYVERAMCETGVETIFYKVRQKPGKPLFFGVKEGKLFFALPGNPASSLVCFYEYVIPAIRKMYGRKDLFLASFRLPLNDDYGFDGERDEFVRGFADMNHARTLVGQESFALRSFAIANALIYLPVSQSKVKKGDLVEVHLLP